MYFVRNNLFNDNFLEKDNNFFSISVTKAEKEAMQKSVGCTNGPSVRPAVPVIVATQDKGQCIIS